VPQFLKRALSAQAESRAVYEWQNRGLRVRAARALVQQGIVTMKDLHAASDHELSTIPNVARKTLVEIYALIGRKLPGNEKSPEQIQAHYDQIWRAKLGNSRFEDILDSIAEMAGETLDRPSIAAGQALWAAARRQRAIKRAG
jgi:hypothetical protein